MITIKDLTLKYGAFTAIDQVSLHIAKNETVGILGLNGAGKTSLMETMEGLRIPTSGMVNIGGLIPHKNKTALHQLIGVQLQETHYPKNAKVFELCELFSAMYDNPLNYDQLLEKVGLANKAKTYVSQLSGGQKQRLSIVLALLPNPQVVFLDELTTGLDPQARQKIWKVIHNLKIQGKTVVIVSHFMDEVQNLCDRVIIMDEGKIVTIGTVEEIIDYAALKRKMSITIEDEIKEEQLRKVPAVASVSHNGNQWTIYGDNERFIFNVIKYLDEQRINYCHMKNESASLEDAFLKLVGKKHEINNEVTYEYKNDNRNYKI